MDLNDVTVSNLLTLTSPSGKADNSKHIFVSAVVWQGVSSAHATRLGTVAMQLRKIKLLCNASRDARCARASGKCLQAGGGSPVAQDFSGHDQEGWNEEALRLRLFNRTKFRFGVQRSECRRSGGVRKHPRFSDRFARVSRRRGQGDRNIGC